MPFRKKKPGGVEEVHRLMIPRQGEAIGLVAAALGASKFKVICSDGKERICSIPGRLKRQFWVKENDVVLVKPWVVQEDVRGDIIWRYSIMDKDQLKARGFEIPK